MIVEQIIDISDPIVAYCFKLFEQCRHRITGNLQKFYVYRPCDNPWLSEDHYELLLDDYINVFIHVAKKMFMNNNFMVNETNTNINVELHCGYAENTYSKEIFKIHKDDNNDTTICTLIIYFDVSCNGGELVFYNSSNDTDIMKIINVNNPSRNECKLVMFDGHHWHKPLPFNNGNRNLLVFHIPAIR